MKGRLIFLLEEPSMKALLDELLPRVFLGWKPDEHFQCVPHEGKSDLDRSIPRKLKGWRVPGDRFVVVRDTDGADCLAIKATLKRMCRQAGRSDTLIRLVCQELEGWYLGDLSALATAFELPKINAPANRKRFIEPDGWQKPSVEVKRLVPMFQKTSGARAMGAHLDATSNTSLSFQTFLQGIHNIATDMGYRD
ncbi:MAG: DUF4276 family protein [Caulobacter sp.]|nr:DUF4276 family protein [Vitreoscilla sp.]